MSDVLRSPEASADLHGHFSTLRNVISERIQARICSFKHRGIDTRKEQIRLFRLDRSLSAGGIICGSLKVSTLDDGFSCLSYQWGSIDDGYEIYIDGCGFKIQSNLRNILSSMLESDDVFTNVWIWIDAICIDQDNPKEKNHQIGLMKRIFSVADKVFVYAGSGNLQIEDAISDTSSWAQSMGYTETVPGRCQKLYPALLHQKIWRQHEESLLALLNLPYWNRAWIKQEIILAPRLMLMYGKSYCPWETITMIVAGGVHLGLLSQQDSPGDAVELIQGSFSADATLYENLKRFSGLECQHPRDKILSLLGISSDSTRYLIDVSVSCEVLFLDTFLIWNTMLQEDSQDKKQQGHHGKIATGIPANHDSKIFVCDGMRWAELRDMCQTLSNALFGLDFEDLDLARLRISSQKIITEPWVTSFAQKSTHSKFDDENLVQYVSSSKIQNKSGTNSNIPISVKTDLQADVSLWSLDSISLFQQTMNFSVPEHSFIACDTGGHEGRTMIGIAQCKPHQHLEQPEQKVECFYVLSHPIKIHVQSVQDSLQALSKTTTLSYNTADMYLDLQSCLELLQLAEKIGHRRSIRKTTSRYQRDAMDAATMDREIDATTGRNYNEKVANWYRNRQKNGGQLGL